MAYSELIKNFSRIREYMREFYVKGQPVQSVKVPEYLEYSKKDDNSD